MTELMAYAGMLGILTAFVLETRGVLDSRGRPYLWLMAAGSALLAVRAMASREWAFLVLEAVWCGASLLALGRPGRRERAAS